MESGCVEIIWSLPQAFAIFSLPTGAPVYLMPTEWPQFHYMHSSCKGLCSHNGQEQACQNIQQTISLTSCCYSQMALQPRNTVYMLFFTCFPLGSFGFSQKILFWWNRGGLWNCFHWNVQQTQRKCLFITRRQNNFRIFLKRGILVVFKQ